MPNLKIQKISDNEYRIIDDFSKQAPWTSTFKNYSSAKKTLDKTYESIVINNAWMN